MLECDLLLQNKKFVT